MSDIHVTTIVFIGKGFNAGMFDERELCPFLGDIDARSTERVEERGRYNYSQGSHQFSIFSERIELNGSGIFPQAVLAAAEVIIASLVKYNSLCAVEGVGLNCDSIFEREESALTGSDFCKALSNRTDVETLLGKTPPLAKVMTGMNFHFEIESVRYNLRIEPHFSTQGENLFVAINAYQNVAGMPELAECLETLAGVQEYTKELHERLAHRSQLA